MTRSKAFLKYYDENGLAFVSGDQLGEIKKAFDSAYDLLLGENQWMKNALVEIAGHATSEEGDQEESEEFFGLERSEIVEMAHDNMILIARSAIKLREIEIV
jgi:hypothetical protein